MSADIRGRTVLDLFERYYERVFLFARGSLDASSAEDVAQEVFTRLLDLRDLERKTISASYLIKIADNLIKRRYRRARRLEAWIDQEIRERGPGHDVRAAGEVERSEEQIRARRTVGELSPAEQDAVRLIVCGGLSYQQAAASLGVEVSAINNWKYRGIQRLKQHATADTPRRPSDRGRDAAQRGGGFGQRAG